jgi:hypothetical protein
MDSEPIFGLATLRKASLIDLAEGFPYVVFTDISAFYENVEIGILVSDVNALGAPASATALLSVCLNRWAQVPSRGLPQGLEASDILAKVYLNPVDRALINRDILHVRYSDDIRIFSHTKVAAQEAMVFLGRLLRARGLNLQAAKSAIVRADTAKVRIDGVIPILQGLLHRPRLPLLHPHRHRAPPMNFTPKPTGAPLFQLLNVALHILRLESAGEWERDRGASAGGRRAAPSDGAAVVSLYGSS